MFELVDSVSDNAVLKVVGIGGGGGNAVGHMIASEVDGVEFICANTDSQALTDSHARPFPFEGRKRMKIAEEGIKQLADRVDSLITVPNEKLLTVLGKQTTLLDAFKAANDVLQGAVKGISDLILRPGMINVDFADVSTVMSEKGMAMMGTGYAKGENRAKEAAEAAIHSPLLENIDLNGARGMLVNITSGLDFSLGEFQDVGDTVEQFVSDDATVVVGTVIDPEMSEEIRVTVVATGLGEVAKPAVPKETKWVKPDLSKHDEVKPSDGFTVIKQVLHRLNTNKEF